MDQSVQYNLRNPGFVEDIGYSCINQMYPVACTNTVATMNPALPGTNINPGQPDKDSFKPNKAQKERNFISKVLILLAVALAGRSIYKRSGAILSKLTSIGNNLGTKLANSGRSLGSKIKKIFKR